MELTIKIIPCGILKTNCYVLSDAQNHGIVIDPGAEGEAILDYVQEQQIAVKYIVNTHGHWDHIGANKIIAKETGAPILIHDLDKQFLEEERLNLSKAFGVIGRGGVVGEVLTDGDMVAVGGISLSVLHTPGHTQGSISLLGDGVVFSGDALFKGSIGRTDLPTGNYEALMKSLGEKLMVLPAETVVYPGHGKPTTIGEEKENNPYIRL